MVIDINIRVSDSFTHGLQAVLSVIEQINRSPDTEDVLNFHKDVFVTPLFILPLMVYVGGCSKNIRYQYENNYLDIIKFADGGIIPENLHAVEFQKLLNRYSSKTYIPIISFFNSNNYTKERNDILSAIEHLLSIQLKLQSNIVIGLKYLIGEIVDNIVEHSDSERGYIFTQYYPQKRYLDVCIADKGITLLGSYEKMEYDSINNDLTAMKAANIGISTKNLPSAENRGYGIQTTKNMLIEGLSGYFIMLSGSAIYLKSKNVDEYMSLPNAVSWKGTIVAMRIPYINSCFNYINFVE